MAKKKKTMPKSGIQKVLPKLSVAEFASEKELSAPMRGALGSIVGGPKTQLTRSEWETAYQKLLKLKP